MVFSCFSSSLSLPPPSSGASWVRVSLFVLSSSALSRRANETFLGFSCLARPSSRMIRSYTFVLHIHFEAFPSPSPWTGFGVVRGFSRCLVSCPPSRFSRVCVFAGLFFPVPPPSLPPPPFAWSFASCIFSLVSRLGKHGLSARNPTGPAWPVPWCVPLRPPPAGRRVGDAPRYGLGG